MREVREVLDERSARYACWDSLCDDVCMWDARHIDRIAHVARISIRYIPHHAQAVAHILAHIALTAHVTHSLARSKHVRGTRRSLATSIAIDAGRAYRAYCVRPVLPCIP